MSSGMKTALPSSTEPHDTRQPGRAGGDIAGISVQALCVHRRFPDHPSEPIGSPDYLTTR
jgi:hypothetical protein